MRRRSSDVSRWPRRISLLFELTLRSGCWSTVRVVYREGRVEIGEHRVLPQKLLTKHTRAELDERGNVVADDALALIGPQYAGDDLEDVIR